MAERTELPTVYEPRAERCETCRYREITALITKRPGGFEWFDHAEIYRDEHHLEEETEESGECHRYPKERQLFLTSNGVKCDSSEHPRVWLDDWCGEWQPKSPPRSPMLDAPIKEINLSIRARKAMVRLKVETVGELCQLTASKILECRNFGLRALEDVRDKLAAHGLALKGDG